MAKYPPLTPEQKEKISEYINSPKKPSEIAKEISIPAKQIGGYLHYLRRPDILVPQSQTTTKPKQVVKEPKKQEVANMALEKDDLIKIQNMVKDVTAKEVAEQVKDLPSKTAEVIENLRKQREQEKQKKAQEIEEQKKKQESESKITGLEKKITSLEEKLKGKPHGVAGGVFGTDHKSYEEFFNCPDCMKTFKTIVGKHGITSVSKQLCGSDEICKSLLAELSGKGYKIEAPEKKKPEKKKEEGVEDEPKEEKSPEQEPEKPKKGHFSLGTATGGEETK